MFVLVACDAQESSTAPECPKIVIVKETAEMTAFRPGPGRDLTDIVLDVRIDRYGGSCETDLEDDRSGQVDVDLQVFFQATRGPANDDRKGKFTYYI